MNQSKESLFKGVFLFAGIYDLVLGAAFMFFSEGVFEMLGISAKLGGSAPYLALIGAFLFVLGIGYMYLVFNVFEENKGLVLIGALYKLAYFLVAIWFYAIDQIPHISFLTIFGVADLIMFLLMIQCYVNISKK